MILKLAKPYQIYQINNITRKPVFGVSDQSQNKLEIFDILVEEWYYLCKNKTKAEIRCTGIAQLTREFVFTYMQKTGFLIKWLML